MAKTTMTAVEPEVVLDFLRRNLPFSDLDEASLRRLAKGCTIDFIPSGTRFLVEGKTEVECLYLVQRGGVRLLRQDEEGHEILADFRGEGGSLGWAALSKDGKANMDAETVEDTFFFKLNKEAFREIVKERPSIAEYYLKTFSGEYINKAFEDLRLRGEGIHDGSSLYLFGTRVGDLMHGPPIQVRMGRTLQQAAAVMVKHSVGSLLIHDPSGEVIGIVTDTDLRKAVAVGMNYEAPIETIMSSPVAMVEHHDNCFDVLLRMMTGHIHHMAVKRDEQVVGMVTSHDIMVIQGKSPMSLFREIAAQRTIEGLYPLGRRIPQVVRTLVEEGAKAGNITRMISVINDRIVDKLLFLLLKELGPPPVPFCWLLMGSEGRKEQTFYTDQDNALIYKDSGDEFIRSASRIYFEAFTERAIDHLIKCGIPPCPGNIMARNPKWRQPYSVWRDYFEEWIAKPEPEEIMHAAIFFDFRSGFGNEAFAEELRSHLVAHCPRQDIFLRYLAANCLESKPPLSFFRNFIVEKNGEHKDTLDLKKRGLAPIADFARVMALKHGVRETNTLLRLERLMEEGHISKELYQDTSESYEFLMQLRLVHQLEMVEEGGQPNNNIDPKRLSDLEKRTLKEAFAVLGRVQSFVKDFFRLNI